MPKPRPSPEAYIGTAVSARRDGTKKFLPIFFLSNVPDYTTGQPNILPTAIPRSTTSLRLDSGWRWRCKIWPIRARSRPTCSRGGRTRGSTRLCVGQYEERKV